MNDVSMTRAAGDTIPHWELYSLGKTHNEPTASEKRGMFSSTSTLAMAMTVPQSVQSLHFETGSRSLH